MNSAQTKFHSSDKTMEHTVLNCFPSSVARQRCSNNAHPQTWLESLVLGLLLKFIGGSSSYIYVVYRRILVTFFGTWRADVKICISSCTAHLYTVLMYRVIKHWKTLKILKTSNLNKSGHITFRVPCCIITGHP